MKCMTRFGWLLLTGLICIGLTACKDDDGGGTHADTGPDVIESDAGDTIEDATEDALEDTSEDVIADAEDTTDAGPDTIPADELGTVIHETMCQVAWDCPNRETLDLLMFYSQYESLDACKTAQPIPPSMLLEGLPDIQASIDAGRIDYDAELAAECADALYEGMCDITKPMVPETCEENLFTGTVQDGGACVMDEECQGGLACATTSECNGTCTPTMEVLCGGEECADDEYCEWAMCQPRKAAGESCYAHDNCMEGLSCDDSSGTSICVENLSKASGEACASQDVCEAGTFCRSAVCTPFEFVDAQETCSPNTLPLRFCKSSTSCQNVQPSGEGTCLPPGDEGDSCETTVHCKAGLYCAEPSPGDPTECMPQETLGSACSRNYDCVTFYCDNSNVCAEPPSCY